MHFVDISLVNAYVIMADHHPSFCNMTWSTGNKKKLEHSDFRLDLVKQMLRKYKPVNPSNVQDIAQRVNRLNGFHYNQSTMLTANNKQARGDCRVCKSCISWKCLTCNVFLCRTSCYERYHTLDDYKM
jgi:hypothetical protein